MDFEQNDDLTEPIEISAQTPQKKRRSGWKIFTGIFLGLSVLANIFLFFVLIAMFAVFVGGYGNGLDEEVIQAESRTRNKIAVITIQGIITGQKARDVHEQLNSARRDRNVKGLILRVNSPGGTLSGSDQIYNEIRKYRDETGEPVVAFMQGLAASGGYYASVACDKIVAEPTVITGSIGVIMSYFVMQGLMEEKLGIQPVIVKSGQKKDWPSSFRQPTQEELQYINDKMINPAYERFVQIVADGRESLTLADTRQLADGSIYGSTEALDKDMIDNIGYLDEAIKQVKSLAGITKAKVVEYSRPFSLASFLSARSKSFLKFDKYTLYELNTPEVLYLWQGH